MDRGGNSAADLFPYAYAIFQWNRRGQGPKGDVRVESTPVQAADIGRRRRQASSVPKAYIPSRLLKNARDRSRRGRFC
jgi:hypothetical protein